MSRMRGTSGGRIVGRRAAVVLAVAVLGLAGCSAGSDSGASSAGDRAAAPSAADGAGGGQAGNAKRESADEAADGKARPELKGVHLIRTAELHLRVKDVPSALASARSVVEGAGGYVGNESTRRDSQDHERSTVVVRVPQERYEAVLDALGEGGEVVSRRTSAEDVTEEVVDVESRLKSQRASVARVRELMDRAEKLSDIVSLEGELSSRQMELEALLAQQSSLKDRTSMATVTLQLTERSAKTESKEEGGPTFTDALSGGWSAFVATLRWLTVVVGAALPFVLALGLALLAWRFTRRLRRPAPAAPAVRGAGGEAEAEGPGAEPAVPAAREEREERD
ncbi:hypothetical protein B9W68_04745 [Streptomyces sp. CS227]|uniref:DUF4349 domain-containing protein n=1 Tax=Streptomyces sp. CS227 TaxID=1982763 RepID=UPI000B418F2F|nr:DUF4349 domain-containing protein [Streptomyces sp. CS227]OWA18231.1 hypothetical protein B9W68_04745 [Streptomyces sp. CS227]